MYSAAFSPNGSAIVLGRDFPFPLLAYAWSSSGFGSKYSDPVVPPTNLAYGVAFSPDNKSIAVAHPITPFVSAYPWTQAGGFGTKYANPATLPPADGRGVAFSGDSTAIAVAHVTTPYITAYPWSVSGFGTKYSNPATLPTGDGRGVAFGPV